MIFNMSGGGEPPKPAKKYLFRNGSQTFNDGTLTNYSDNGFKWVTNNSHYQSDSYIATLLTQVNLTDYKWLVVRVHSASGVMGNGGQGGVVIKDENTRETFSSTHLVQRFPKAGINSDTTYIIDLSTYTGTKYIGLNHPLLSAFITHGTFEITEMYVSAEDVIGG